MRVKCIKGEDGSLTEGKIYKVVNDSNVNSLFYRVTGDNKEKLAWFKSRFKIVEDNTEKRNSLIAELKKAQQNKENES